MKKSQYFPKPYKTFGGNINVTADLSNYSTKADLKNRTGFDTTKFAKKVGLAHLKSDVHKLSTDKL